MFDVDKEIEQAKKRLHAFIYGREEMPIEIDFKNFGRDVTVSVGEYKIGGVLWADVSIKPNESTLTMQILLQDVKART